jgi:AcrR family transcriptional regulator
MTADLLQKIETLFFENAFAELSMDEIARNLGIKKASLYYHFSSKEAMFLEVLRFSHEKYISFLDDVFKETDLQKIIRSLISFPLENKNLFSIILQRGYCKIEAIQSFILEKTKENQEIFLEKF